MKRGWPLLLLLCTWMIISIAQAQFIIESMLDEMESNLLVTTIALPETTWVAIPPSTTSNNNNNNNNNNLSTTSGSTTGSSTTTTTTGTSGSATTTTTGNSGSTIGSSGYSSTGVLITPTIIDLHNTAKKSFADAIAKFSQELELLRCYCNNLRNSTEKKECYQSFATTPLQSNTGCEVCSSGISFIETSKAIATNIDPTDCFSIVASICKSNMFALNSLGVSCRMTQISLCLALDKVPKTLGMLEKQWCKQSLQLC